MSELTVVKPYSDLYELTPYKSTVNGHIRYDCPYCISVRGKEDKAGKLYYNTKKGVGKCFKCDTVVVEDWRANRLNGSRSRLKELLNKDEEDQQISSSVRYSLRSWSCPANSHPISRSYLSGRGIDRSTTEKYYLRYIEDPIKGILIPETPDIDSTTYFQVRTIDSWFRWLNPRGTPKSVYGDLFLDNTPKYLIITEGVFSALSASSYLRQEEDYGVVATYSKSITKSAIKRLKMIGTKNFILSYDGGELDAIVKQGLKLKEKIPNSSVFGLLLPFDQDPNDLSREDYLRLFSKALVPIDKTSVDFIYKLAGRPKKWSKKSGNPKIPWDLLRNKILDLNQERETFY